MATASKSPAARLDDLEAAVEKATTREREMEAQRRSAGRRVAALQSRLHAIEEERGAGVEPDPTVESKIHAEIADARREADDDVWAARLAGARRAREEAEQARDDLARARYVDLAGDLVEVEADEEARCDLQEAWEQREAAEENYAARLRRHHRLARQAGHDVDEIPSIPTRGDEGEVRTRFLAGIEPPTPRSLRP